MTEKCTKYEALFTFGNEETLKSHIESCEDCRHEQVIMDKVSDLLKEVKPYYKTKRQNVLKLKMNCSVFSILLSGNNLGIDNFFNDFKDIVSLIMLLIVEYYVIEMDSYGFLVVE